MTMNFMRNFKKLFLMLSCILYGTMLGGCHQKSVVFEKEQIRFFPSALYFQGNQGLYDDSESVDDSLSLKVMVQFLAESEEDVNQFYDDIQSIDIIGNHGNKVKASMMKGDIEKIKQENVRDQYHLNGYFSGKFDIIFDVNGDFKADKIQIEKKDGSILVLDSLIDVRYEDVDAKKKGLLLTHYAPRNDSSGELYNIGQDLSELSEPQIKLEQVHYPKDVLNASLLQTKYENRLVIESKEPWRTINYYIYIDQGDVLIPAYGEIYFEFFYSVADKLI